MNKAYYLERHKGDEWSSTTDRISPLFSTKDKLKTWCKKNNYDLDKLLKESNGYYGHSIIELKIL